MSEGYIGLSISLLGFSILGGLLLSFKREQLFEFVFENVY
jgi:hypothetical protein